jgi:hypothetical protein
MSEEGKMLLLDAMQGKKIPRSPSVPKLWLDVAANILGQDYLPLFGDPLLSSETIARAAMCCECDGARVFLFPKRDVRKEGEYYYHYNESGKRLGSVDIQGGWATLFDDPDDIDFSDPMTIINYQYFKSKMPIINESRDLKRLVIPSLSTFHGLYDDYIDSILKFMGEKCCPMGDCNSGTLAFCISMLGMDEALVRMITEPDFIKDMMSLGMELSIIQAKFMIDKGIRVLRLNDSAANMRVISPEMWREFIKPWFTKFCNEIHHYCADAKIYCHICGDIRRITGDLIESGIDCIAPLDPLAGVNIAEVRKITGNDFMLMGGVNTLSFINKTPSEIMKEAERCISEGFTNHGHFAIGSGCALPRATKIEAIMALSAASRNMANL